MTTPGDKLSIDVTAARINVLAAEIVEATHYRRKTNQIAKAAAHLALTPSAVPDEEAATRADLAIEVTHQMEVQAQIIRDAASEVQRLDRELRRLSD